MSVRLIRLKEVENLTGLRRTRIYELEQAGHFPARVRLSDRATAWRSDEVEQWINDRPRADDVPPDNDSNLKGRATA